MAGLGPATHDVACFSTASRGWPARACPWAAHRPGPRGRPWRGSDRSRPRQPFGRYVSNRTRLIQTARRLRTFQVGNPVINLLTKRQIVGFYDVLISASGGNPPIAFAASIADSMADSKQPPLKRVFVQSPIT